MAKHKALPPRRKRMKRQARLQSAVRWIPTYSGRNLVRGYARWYGVDLLCAAKELEMLGRPAPAGYVACLRVTAQERAKAAAAKKAQAAERPTWSRNWRGPGAKSSGARSTLRTWRDGPMDYDTEKVDDAVLALLYLTADGDSRAWKGHDWGAMERLHQKGYIGNPVSKAKSVPLTPEGMARSRELFYRLFGKPEQD